VESILLNSLKNLNRKNFFSDCFLPKLSPTNVEIERVRQNDSISEIIP